MDGKKIAEKILSNAKSETAALKEKGITPKLVVVQVGSDPASTVYVEKKYRACIGTGIDSEIRQFPEYISEEMFLSEIRHMNEDPKIHGILVQLPLPKGINGQKVLESVDPAKDVDGFNPINTGKNFSGADSFKPATLVGIMRLLEETGVKLPGKNAVVIGRSNIVGKPVAVMLINAGCTVTVCNRKTKNLAAFTSLADILISAAGKPGLVKGKMVKAGAIVIDVGTTKGPGGKLVGDVDFAGVRKKASWITPVPGGVGPMTIASVIVNTLRACRGLEGA